MTGASRTTTLSMPSQHFIRGGLTSQPFMDYPQGIVFRGTDVPMLGLISFVLVAVFAAVAAYAQARSPSVHARRLGMLCLLLAVNSLANGAAISAQDASSASSWNRLAIATWAATLSMQLVLMLGLTRWRLPAHRLWPVLVSLPAALTAVALMISDLSGPAAMVATAQGWAWDTAAVPGLQVILATYYLFTAAVLAAWGARSRDRRERRQVAWLLGAGLVAMAGAAAFISAHPLDEPPNLPRIPHIFASIWALGYGVAILRHGLLDLRPVLALDHLLQAMQDLFLLVDPQGRISAANPRSATLLGLPPEQLLGRRLADLVVDQAGMERVLADLQAGSAAAGAEILMKDREGVGIPLLLAGGPLQGRAGEPLGLALVAQDQRPIREMIKAGRLESIGILAGGLAHDFNNLLTGIWGHLQLIRAELPSDSPLERRLSEAGNACQRATDLTQQLLTFSRGGAPVRRPTSLSDVIRDSAGFATAGSPARLDLSLRTDLWPVDGDAGQLSRVVHNLVLNAVQAMPGGGAIRIRGFNLRHGVEVGDGSSPERRPEDQVRFTVSDDGPGIPADHLSRIFDPFYSTKSRGTGLGLAIVSSIVRRHGGRIEVFSQPGNGTTFRVDLPRGAPIGGTKAGLDSSGPVVRRVLVMDDEVVVRRVAADMLVRLGCQADTCADGVEAIAKTRDARVRGTPFETLILDLTVPGGMGGAEAARTLRQDDPAVRLVVCSGYAEDPVMDRYRDHGFDAVLPKPYSLEQLREAVVERVPATAVVDAAPADEAPRVPAAASPAVAGGR